MRTQATQPTLDATEAGRRREQHRDHSTLPARLRRRGEVLVLDGHGASLSVARGRLVARDRSGGRRRERSFGKVSHSLARVVVLAGTGSVSLAAVHWLADQGVPLVTIDSDGRLLTTSAITIEDARLIRAQALAPHTEQGLAVTRYLLGEKLRGQQTVLGGITVRDDLVEAFAFEADRLDHATSLDEMLDSEREAASIYWAAWRDTTIRFAPTDTGRVPDHWQMFGQRASPLSGGNRAPVNPINAILGYLYTVAISEAKIACGTLGLSPVLGITHADYRHRDSFCLDLIEPARPLIDTYVLGLIANRVFRVDDFYETRRGHCRILPPLTRMLAATGPDWAATLAPIAEHVTRLLADTPDSRIDSLPTPLTRQNHSAARDARRKRPALPRPPRTPERTCARCGGDLPHQRRTYCPPCETLFREEQKTQAGAGTSPLEVVRKRDRSNSRRHGSRATRRDQRPAQDRRTRMGAGTRQAHRSRGVRTRDPAPDQDRLAVRAPASDRALASLHQSDQAWRANTAPDALECAEERGQARRLRWHATSPRRCFPPGVSRYSLTARRSVPAMRAWHEVSIRLRP